MITFFLLLLFLDIQHPPKPESPLAGFVVNDAVDNSALTGCTMNPSSGGKFNADMISVDWVNNNDPHEGETSVSHLPEPGFGDEALITPMVMPYDPPGLPDPNPEPPPVAVVPEPPTAAILTVSAVVLLFLLFGRRRLARR